MPPSPRNGGKVMPRNVPFCFSATEKKKRTPEQFLPPFCSCKLRNQIIPVPSHEKKNPKMVWHLRIIYNVKKIEDVLRKIFHQMNAPQIRIFVVSSTREKKRKENHGHTEILPFLDTILSKESSRRGETNFGYRSPLRLSEVILLLLQKKIFRSNTRK